MYSQVMNYHLRLGGKIKITCRHAGRRSSYRENTIDDRDLNVNFGIRRMVTFELSVYMGSSYFCGSGFVQFVAILDPSLRSL